MKSYPSKISTQIKLKLKVNKLTPRFRPQCQFTHAFLYLGQVLRGHFHRV